jgi:hypothetical protein
VYSTAASLAFMSSLLDLQGFAYMISCPLTLSNSSDEAQSNPVLHSESVFSTAGRLLHLTA